MKKKAYKQPQFNVIEVEQTDIICTSTQSTLGIKNGEGYGEEDW